MYRTINSRIKSTIPYALADSGWYPYLFIRRCEFYLNPILHTAWLDNHALTLKSNIANYFLGKKSSFLHTFIKF
jgi:hypothetical protein